MVQGKPTESKRILLTILSIKKKIDVKVNVVGHFSTIRQKFHNAKKRKAMRKKKYYENFWGNGANILSLLLLKMIYECEKINHYNVSLDTRMFTVNSSSTRNW